MTLPKRFEKADVPAFDRFDALAMPTVTDIIIPNQHLMPVSVSFKPGNKWRLTDGDKAHLYTVSDEQFNKEVSQGRKVGGNDVFVCEVRLR